MANETSDERVTLVSSDGFEFIVDQEVAMVSGTIRNMLTGSGTSTFTEAKDKRIRFRTISGDVLERVIQYFYYKVKYTNTTGDIPQFEIEPKYALELLMAANFLET
mmetsp:Transcript_1803/g.3005  ORF Transcript_1803/g.3005 Transcript_1803/m.3005 type:complete len:106 (+) Transcript_1803:194-511(+)|eukprot:CAMPEP_0168583698 /NCGR_PEP_ID=MMETSP0420-20121227/2719_1 /TAXON_ID=498008 /ORGANISM="Pessonella sp." /LENGTH=105 /DNA_ID=CAMNT_0008618399 /DNA_START=955 /DNA_END=1272 /DNA_ORIENTATION=+